MKLNYCKEWYDKRIDLEGDSEIGAGFLSEKAGRPEEKITLVDTRLAFGTFVWMWRRNQGWDAARLADEAGLEPQEILEIERDPHCEIEPHAVYKLAEVFGLPAKPLLELAGLIPPRTASLREEAVRFAARSEPVTALNQHERQVLESFVSAIASSVKAKK